MANKIKNNGEWVCTDPNEGIEQYGKQLSEKVFVFKQKGTEEAQIDLDEYTQEEIEDAIEGFRYTLDISRKGTENIFMQYGIKDAYWIIAECIFEHNITDFLLDA